jgi:hypothetical protein
MKNDLLTPSHARLILITKTGAAAQQGRAWARGLLPSNCVAMVHQDGVSCPGQGETGNMICGLFLTCACPDGSVYGIWAS